MRQKQIARMGRSAHARNDLLISLDYSRASIIQCLIAVPNGVVNLRLG